jgi:hypothetical protein
MISKLNVLGTGAAPVPIFQSRHGKSRLKKES